MTLAALRSAEEDVSQVHRLYHGRVLRVLERNNARVNDALITADSRCKKSDPQCYGRTNAAHSELVRG